MKKIALLAVSLIASAAMASSLFELLKVQTIEDRTVVGPAQTVNGSGLLVVSIQGGSRDQLHRARIVVQDSPNGMTDWKEVQGVMFEITGTAAGRTLGIPYTATKGRNYLRAMATVSNGSDVVFAALTRP